MFLKSFTLCKIYIKTLNYSNKYFNILGNYYFVQPKNKLL